MPVLTHEELKSLAATQAAACVSIYLPTHGSGPDSQQDSIRLKNMLGEAERRLASNGLRSNDARRLLAPADELVPRHNFAQASSAGLAIFLGPDTFQHYWLPFPVEEVLNIGRRFHLKPLLPMLAPDGIFYVLALSQNSVRLLEGTRHSVREVELPGVPKSLAEATAGEEGENLPQYRGGQRGPGANSPQQAGVYHGTAAAGDETRVDLLRFFHMVDEGLRAWLGPSVAPLVVAGVEYLHPVYRDANEYPHLVEQGITGNAEGARPEDLHAQAWEIVRPLFTAGRAAAAEQFRQLAGNGDGRAATNVATIVPAGAPM